MKPIHVFFLIILSVFTACSSQAPESFTLKNIQGASVSLTDFKDQVVLINFWRTDCPPCVEEMDSLEKLHQKFKSKGFSVIAINIFEEQSAVENFLKEHKLTFPILIDKPGAIAKQFGVAATPESFILNRQGKTVERIIGGQNWMSDVLQKKIEERF